MIKRVLMLLGFYLFFSGYSISSIWLPDGLDKAWDIRMLLISIYTLLLFIALSVEEPEKYKRFNRFLSFIMMALVLVDIAHKVVGINEFWWMDYVIITTSTVLSYLIYYTNLIQKLIDNLCQRLNL